VNAFELLRTEQVALPIHSWAVDLTLEEDRPLPRLEETILRLAQVGVCTFPRFVELLGLDERQVARAFGDLRLKAALSADAGSYEITTAGSKLLEKAAMKSLRKVGVRVWHDPYADTLKWEDYENDEVLSGEEQRNSGLRALHAPVELRADELRARQREIQALMNENGLPEDSEQADTLPERHLMNVTPKGHSTYYILVELTVYRHVGTGEFAFMLNRNGAPDKVTTLALRALAEQQVDLVPLKPLRTLPSAAQRLMDRMITLVRGAEVLSEDDPRYQELLRRAVQNVQHTVTMLGSFSPGSDLGQDDLRAMRTLLLRRPDLQSRVLITSDEESMSSSGDARQLLDQFQTLEAIGDRLHVLEVLDLQAEGVIVDEAWGILRLRLFAQHPAKREAGLPYDRTYFISDVRALQTFQADVQAFI